MVNIIQTENFLDLINNDNIENVGYYFNSQLRKIHKEDNRLIAINGIGKKTNSWSNIDSFKRSCLFMNKYYTDIHFINDNLIHELW